MTFGKEARPLPMYERKVLKHVPTMVRRRYDRDLDKKFDATQGSPTEVSESKGDDGAEDAHPVAFSDEDDFVDDEVEDESQAIFDDEQDTLSITDDFGYSMHSEDGKSQSGGAEDVNFASFMDANVKDKIEDDGHAEIDNNQEDCKDKDDGPIDANTLTNYVDVTVKNEFLNYEQGLHVVEDSKTEGDETKNAYIARDYVDDNVQDEVEDKDQGNSDNNQDMLVEDRKSEGDGIEGSKIASDYVDDNAQDEVEDKVQGNFDNKQDMQMENSKSEDDGTEDANIASYEMDDSVQEVEEKDQGNFDNKQEMRVEDRKSKGDGTNVQGNTDNKQGMQLEYRKSEGYGAKDANVVSYNMDDSAKVEVLDKEHGNFDNKHGILLEDRKSQGQGAEDEDLASYVDDGIKMEIHDKGLENSNTEQDFSPKAFKQTLERDGYDLCCPKCKQLITHTMIFRRKEDYQQHQTTCLTFLTALFCCLRW